MNFKLKFLFLFLMEKRPTICEYDTYSVKPFINDTFSLDNFIDNDIEKKIICKIYLNEEYDSSNPQISENSLNEDGFQIETYRIEKEQGTTTLTSIVSLCCRRNNHQISYANLTEPYFITYDFDSIGETLHGYHVYKVNTESIKDLHPYHTNYGDLEITIHDEVLLGAEEINIDTINFILPQKGILLEGIHKDSIENGFTGKFPVKDMTHQTFYKV